MNQSPRLSSFPGFSNVRRKLEWCSNIPKYRQKWVLRVSILGLFRNQIRKYGICLLGCLGVYMTTCGSICLHLSGFYPPIATYDPRAAAPGKLGWARTSAQEIIPIAAWPRFCKAPMRPQTLGPNFVYKL